MGNLRLVVLAGGRLMTRDINRTRRDNNRTSCFLSSLSNENADFSSDLLDKSVVTIILGMCRVFIMLRF